MYICLFLLVFGFFLLCRRMHAVEKAGEILKVARQSLYVVLDEEVADEVKESILKENSLRLLWLLVLVISAVASSVLCPLLVVYAIGTMGLVPFKDVMRAAMSYEFFLVSFGFFGLFWVIERLIFRGEK